MMEVCSLRQTEGVTGGHCIWRRGETDKGRSGAKMKPQGHRRYPWSAREQRTGSGAWRPGGVSTGGGGRSCKETIQGAGRISARPRVRVDFLLFVSCLSHIFTQLPCTFVPTCSGGAAFAAAAERRQPTLQGRRVDVHHPLDRPARAR